jgi:alkylation response protein AidB-like acyl-CoA dehydrogenase
MPDHNEILAKIAAAAESADRTPAWPENSWELAKELGALRWSLPKAYGGLEISGIELLNLYERLASACLTTMFILSQRESACRHLLGQAPREALRDLMPGLARGEHFATVGLSHLTTSRRHGPEAMRATSGEHGYVLDGTLPWVTGAERADYFVTGAVLEDGRQILIVLPRKSAGVTISPPMDLAALAGSITAEVRCERVAVDRRWLLLGPAEKVLSLGRRGAGGLETSCLAIGLATAAIRQIELESRERPELEPTLVRLQRLYRMVRDLMHELCTSSAPVERFAELRARANSLVLRATQAALTASKGSGFRHPHPAQRWARQALFFLVWSCPWPAAEATLDALVGGGDCGLGE